MRHLWINSFITWIYVNTWMYCFMYESMIDAAWYLFFHSTAIHFFLVMHGQSNNRPETWPSEDDKHRKLNLFMFIFHLLGVTDYFLLQNVFFNIGCHVSFSSFFLFCFSNFFNFLTMIKGEEIKCGNSDFSRFSPVFSLTENVQTWELRKRTFG